MTTGTDGLSGWAATYCHCGLFDDESTCLLTLTHYVIYFIWAVYLSATVVCYRARGRHCLVGLAVFGWQLRTRVVLSGTRLFSVFINASPNMITDSSQNASAALRYNVLGGISTNLFGHLNPHLRNVLVLTLPGIKMCSHFSQLALIVAAWLSERVLIKTGCVLVFLFPSSLVPWVLYLWVMTKYDRKNAIENAANCV